MGVFKRKPIVPASTYQSRISQARLVNAAIIWSASKMANAIPLTRQTASKDKAEAIRRAVRKATVLQAQDQPSRLARIEDAPALFSFLSNPDIHAPIYTLPKPLTVDTVADFIIQHTRARTHGEGLLFINHTESGAVAGYSDICIWPQWAAGELGGAVHPDRQGKGNGLRGAERTFDWMFSHLGLEVICETAAPDNIRTARLLDHLDFRRKGEIESTRLDGSTRPSRVWEITRSEWQAR